jgi:hypothetical protein
MSKRVLNRSHTDDLVRMMLTANVDPVQIAVSAQITIDEVERVARKRQFAQLISSPSRATC